MVRSKPLMHGISTHLLPDIVCEGWVLKKRRKKMQGFARRYFTLYPSGILSYSFEPGQPIRDQVSLHHAAISTAPGRKDIHIDSNTATFHIKCLSMEDFNTWMVAFRTFVSLSTEARKSATMKLASRHESLNLSKIGSIAEEMGSSISILEDTIMSMVQEVAKSKSHHGLNKRSRSKDHGKESKFHLFKKSSNQAIATDSSMSDSVVPDHMPLSVQRVMAALDNLKVQHAALLKSLPAHPTFDSNRFMQAPLPITAEEEEQPDQLEQHDSPRLMSPTSKLSRKSSISTFVSDSVQEWFDALEGAEEFVMDVQITPEGSGPPSHLFANDTRSAVSHQEDSSADTDTEENDKPLSPDERPRVITGSPNETSGVIRRTKLPASPAGEEGSLFAILKKNIGKDLATITFPVSFNEPLTLLQRAAEEVEYYSILEQAAESDDMVDRFCYVAAFAVSSYAHTRYRSGRKGFNPMLGETFEDQRMRFIAEKVRHNPLEIAYHAEGVKWELHGTSSARTKFWGKSLEVIPLGTSHLRINNDHYVWKKPSSFMRNLMMGTKYLEHCGQMTIENSHNQTRCVLDFKQGGYWGPSNIVSGVIYGTTGDILSRMEGKWDNQMAQTFDSLHFRVLWRMIPFPKNTHEYYGFTSFGFTLNELTSDIIGKLPPTDSRHRPDVRALENGEIDVAEEQKIRIEEMQRERRRRGEDRQPRWFKQVGDEWMYCGGYWEARDRGWKGEDIISLW